MATQRKKNASDGKEEITRGAKSGARVIPIAQRGVRTSRDFANMMDAVMCDLALGSLSPDYANAMTKAGGKLLKVCELQFKYGTPGKDGRAAFQMSAGS